MTGEEEELTTWTLGDIKSAGMVLEGACATPNCNEFARFDLDGLISRFGADWSVPATLPVRCSLCGEPLKFQLAVLHDKECARQPAHSGVAGAATLLQWPT